MHPFPITGALNFINMRRIIVFALLMFSLSSLKAQEIKVEPGKQFMQITTVESVVGGGLGRSKMIVTNPDGSQKESDLENLFSLAGINFKNIRENEDKIVKILKSYTDEGWKVDYVTSFTLSPSDNGLGIFMTRYLLSKPDSKRAF
jgi:hypothetical protein